MKRSKYRNKKTVVDGLKFGSKKEARYYLHLRNLEREGKIRDLKTQVRFDFTIEGKMFRYVDSNRPVTYYADFTYIEDGKLKVVDVKCEVFKGRLTEAQKKRKAALIRPEYKLKKALMMSVHNILIEEV